MQLQKAKRYRGVILTDRGWEEFQAAKVRAELAENAGDRFTLEELSEHTGLSLNTIAKVLGRNEPVDKQSLQWAFRAFGLELDKNDYTRPREEEVIGGGLVPSEDVGATSALAEIAAEQEHRFGRAEATQTHQTQIDWGNAIDTSIELWRY